jgi:hypothetical protein
MSDYFFFTDPSSLNPQVSADAFGPNTAAPSGTDEFRVTSTHTATVNPIAYAACSAVICVQPVQGNPLRVNIVLQPLAQPGFAAAAHIKYIIYKGILANSLIAGTDAAAAGNNDLTNDIQNTQTKKNNAAGTGDSAPASALGVDRVGGMNFDDAQPIDNLFFNTGVDFQLQTVAAGCSIGQFDKDGFGIEILMGGLNYDHKLALARAPVNSISVPSLNGGESPAQIFDHWHAKEQVLGFMDPCAFYGSFFGVGVMVRTNGQSSPKVGNDLYSGPLSTFVNRNTAYLDIRNEHNFSLDYFKNYGGAIQISYDPDNAATAPVDYYAGKWPLMALDASFFPSGNTTRARNRLRLQLPVGDNAKPLVFVQQGYRDIKSKGDGFPAEPSSAERFFDAFETPTTAYTATKNASAYSALDFAVPNVTGQSATTPVSCHIRLKYLKQEQGAATSPTAIVAGNYADNLVYPLEMRVLFAGNETVKSTVYEEDVYVNAQDTLGCDFIGKAGIARDIDPSTNTGNTTLFVVPSIVRTQPSRAAAPPPLFGETSDIAGGYANVVASKSDTARIATDTLSLTSGTVLVANIVSDADPTVSDFTQPDFDKLVLLTVDNATYDSWKTKAAAANPAIDPRFRAYLGVDNMQAQQDLSGTDYTSFQLSLRGTTATSATDYGAAEMNTDPSDNVTDVMLYTAASTVSLAASPSLLCVRRNGSIQIAAPDYLAHGSCVWSITTSSNNNQLQTLLALTNATTNVVTISAVDQISTFDEIVTLQVNGKTRNYTVRVIDVIFTAPVNPGNTTWGFDEMSGIQIPHACLAKDPHTYVGVSIRGGGSERDIEFGSSNSDIRIYTPQASGGRSDFNIMITAGDIHPAVTVKALNKDSKRNSSSECARLIVNVYTEKIVDAVITRVYDSHSNGTALQVTSNSSSYSVGAATRQINSSYRGAVASVTLHDGNAHVGGPPGYRDIRYDLDNDGFLLVDIGQSALETDVLKSLASQVMVAGKTNVIIVRDIHAYVYLNVAAHIGDGTVTFRSIYGPVLDNIEVCSNPPTIYTFGSGATAEPVEFSTRNGQTFTLVNHLTKEHPVTDGLLMNIDGLSGDPIYISEAGCGDLPHLYWTIAHELGHSGLGLSDVTDPTNLMHFQARTAVTPDQYRLRLDARQLHYKPANSESQWQKIIRP